MSSSTKIRGEKSDREFLIYFPSLKFCYLEMKNYFNALTKEEGVTKSEFASRPEIGNLEVLSIAISWSYHSFHRRSWEFGHLIKISRLQIPLLDERMEALHCSGSWRSFKKASAHGHGYVRNPLLHTWYICVCSYLALLLAFLLVHSIWIIIRLWN